jgi:pyrroloquinoline quinone biosynthesis protein B
LHAIVLGSAAGGGVPQWNCACRVCALARSGDPRVKPRTQTSVALSADEDHWLLVCASPDLRQQVLSTPALWPRGVRDSPIFGVVLLNAEVDGLAGLLTMRERQPFRLFAPEPMLTVLRENPIFRVLHRSIVSLEPVKPDSAVECGHGLRFRLMPVPGKLPLYQEAENAGGRVEAEAYALAVEVKGRRLLIAPSCAEITASVRDMVGGSDVALFDGTLFTDDELLSASAGTKTARRMGHVAISDAAGPLARFAGLGTRLVLLHINNTNPVLIENSPQRRMVEEAGFEVAWDGMEITL